MSRSHVSAMIPTPRVIILIASNDKSVGELETKKSGKSLVEGQMMPSLRMMISVSSCEYMNVLSEQYYNIKRFSKVPHLDLILIS